MSDPTGPDLDRLRALDGQLVNTAHPELREDVDGAPLGVETVPDGDPPATFHVPWGHVGLPSREDVYGPKDDA